MLGHVSEMNFEPSYSSWERLSPIELMNAPVVCSPMETMKSLCSSLESLARGSDLLVICTDCDREGEYIGDEIRTICTQAKRGLEVRRAHFSGLTRAELVRALEHSRPLDQRMVDSVKARMELDLRMGAALTRYQTIKLRRGSTEKGPIVSYGT